MPLNEKNLGEGSSVALIGGISKSVINIGADFSLNEEETRIVEIIPPEPLKLAVGLVESGFRKSEAMGLEKLLGNGELEKIRQSGLKLETFLSAIFKITNMRLENKQETAFIKNAVIKNGEGNALVEFNSDADAPTDTAAPQAAKPQEKRKTAKPLRIGEPQDKNPEPVKKTSMALRGMPKTIMECAENEGATIAEIIWKTRFIRQVVKETLSLFKSLGLVKMSHRQRDNQAVFTAACPFGSNEFPPNLEEYLNIAEKIISAIGNSKTGSVYEDELREIISAEINADISLFEEVVKLLEANKVITSYNCPSNSRRVFKSTTVRYTYDAKE